MAKYKFSKPVRRANEQELNWIYERLSRGLETRDIIFSVEKILKERVLLRVRSEGEIYSVYLNFRTERFSMPKKLEKES